MEAARAGVRGLRICGEAARIIRGLTASDVASATTLLDGAVRAMLITVDFNLQEMTADSEFTVAVEAESIELANETKRYTAAVAETLAIGV